MVKRRSKTVEKEIAVVPTTQTFRKKPKTGRHTFKMNGKKVTAIPGQVITCGPACLGSFVSDYDLLSPSESKTVVEEIGKQLQVVSRGRGYYNIINIDNPDKPLNNKALRKEEAEKILEQLLSDLDVAGDSIVPGPLSSLDWDSLVSIMESEDIELLPEYEDEETLREVIYKAREGRE